MPDPIPLPSFAHGTVAVLRRRLKSEARRQARAWRDSGAFLDFEEVPVPDGTGVYVSYNDDLAQLDPANEAWRPYFVDLLYSAPPSPTTTGNGPMSPAASPSTSPATPGGRCSNSLSAQHPNTIPRVASRDPADC